MAKRRIIFEETRYYHIFNRGVDKRIIFHDKEDVSYFLGRLKDFNDNSPVGGIHMQNTKKRKNARNIRGPASNIVEIVAYCVLPNHFHLVLKQVSEDGIAKFMQRVCTGYAMYYNKKYERSGALLQGRFKATELKGRGSLEMLSVYVNLNYKHHMIDPKKKIVKSSLGEYLEKNLKHNICDQKEVKKIMGVDNKNKKLYMRYAKMQSKYFTENKGNDIKGINFDEFEK